MKLIEFIVRWITRLLIWLRYDVTFKGKDAVAERGKSGILFLPNHPAYIDPIIVYNNLRAWFGVRGVADQDQLERPIVGYFGKKWGVRGIPPVDKYGTAGREKIREVLGDTIEGLRRGENVVIWPSGGLYRSKHEDLSANSSVEEILKAVPEVRVVLVRTRGLWGSGFSWAKGREPMVGEVLGKGTLQLPANGIFFMPRRKVTVELYEPEDLPREQGREALNRFIEAYYNEDAPGNTYVPYYFWEKGGVREEPEPTFKRSERDIAHVPESTKQIVRDYLSDVSGVKEIRENAHLARDLGLDSLARGDILMWLEQEFGFEQVDADILETAGDVMLAASGELVSAAPAEVKAPRRKWFSPEGGGRLTIGKGETIPEVFLDKASRRADKAVVADQRSGVLTYRKAVRSCLALQEIIRKMEGEDVGIMLPAGAGTYLLFLATLFAGKTAVMVNWTTGGRNVELGLEHVGVQRVITSKLLLERLKRQGLDFSVIEEKFVYVENLKERISFGAKLRAALFSYVNWSPLRKAKVREPAAVLFTSGSETVPKAVPLSHTNLLSNLRDVFGEIEMSQDDKLVGFLPAFHSFGLTCTGLVSLCTGARTVYHPNPMEGAVLAEIVRKYGVTVIMGTPRFLNGIVQAGSHEQLEGVRLAVTGADKCSERIYAALEKKCPKAQILEGYGVTECSPIITVNRREDARKFSIGRILPSLDYRLLDPESGKATGKEGRGILVVRGPSVFEGYIKYEREDVFVEIEGKRWYNTGDIVEVDPDGIFTFRGRVKRFAKVGGEMVSLPAIEDVLDKAFAQDGDEGPSIAVIAAGDENSELVLYTTRDIEREEANTAIREEGLSGLHSIRRVEKIDEMPLLGTGKTDYRKLKEMETNT